MSKYAVALFVFCFASAALGQTGPSLLLTPNLSEDELWEGRADALFLNNGSTSNNRDFRASIYELSGRFREQRERFVPRIGFDMKYLDVDSTEPLLPKNLTDVSLAAGVELGHYFNWRSGLTVGIGYAGDTPFDQSDAWYGKATLLFGRSLDKKTDVAVVLDYDGNRSTYPDIPIPGFAYRHEFDPTLSYTVGVPVSAVTWKPFDPLKIQITWTMLDAFDGRVEYEVVPKFIVYGAFESRQEAFHTQAIHGNNRLLFQQRRAELGVRWEPLQYTRLNVAGGYAFAGEFSAGFDQRDSDLIADVGDEPYIRLGFERQF